jgi:hypothetical protein
MSDLHFFMTRKDTEAFLDFLVSEFAASFTAGWSYASTLPEFKTTVEVLNYVDSAPHRLRFFVRSGRWTIYPLSSSGVMPKNGTQTIYSVDQRYGGPAFDLLISNDQAGKKTPFIIGGWFSDYPSYYLKRGSPEWFKRPEGMTEAFKAVQKYIRRNGRQTRHSEKPSWNGGWALADAMYQHERGVWLRLGDNHFIPDTPKSANQTLKRSQA